MLKELSQELFGFLTAQTSFTDVMGNRIFPIMANENNVFPLTTFRINETLGKTKDNDGASFQIVFWFDTEQYDEYVDFTDAMKSVLLQKYRWVSSTIDVDENSLKYNGIINLETK